MSRAEAEAQKLTENQGILWRPLLADGIGNDYLISERREIFQFRRRTLLSCKGKNTVRLQCGQKSKSFRLDTLMRTAFPEQFPEEREAWRTILLNGEPSCYEVTASGKVRRRDTHRLLRPVQRADGYCLLRLRHRGQTVPLYLHRIVAAAFLPECGSIRHKDGNRGNNAAANLESRPQNRRRNCE